MAKSVSRLKVTVSRAVSGVGIFTLVRSCADNYLSRYQTDPSPQPLRDLRRGLAFASLALLPAVLSHAISITAKCRPASP